MARAPITTPPRIDGPRVNERITVNSVRLVDEDGEQVGVVPTRDAQKRAFDAGLDLVEVSPNAEPPVCKIMDYGRFRFETQKKKNEARKKQKIVDLKELKVRPNIDTHDYEVKMRAAAKFISAGDKVKVTMRFRGREITHQEVGLEVLKRIENDLIDVAKTELRPKMEGRQMIMILAPNKS